MSKIISPTKRLTLDSQQTDSWMFAAARDLPKSRAGHFRYFLIFSLIKNDILQVNIWLGVGFLNRTGSEAGY